MSIFEVDSYVVYPTGYDDMAHSDKDAWCLTVVNGHAYGWSIRRGMGAGTSTAAMNRKGQWIHETRGSKSNRFRRYGETEALDLAARHVDTLRLNGVTAAEASAEVAARLESAKVPTTSHGNENGAVMSGAASESNPVSRHERT